MSYYVRYDFEKKSKKDSYSKIKSSTICYSRIFIEDPKGFRNISIYIYDKSFRRERGVNHGLCFNKKTTIWYINQIKKLFKFKINVEFGEKLVGDIKGYYNNDDSKKTFKFVKITFNVIDVVKEYGYLSNSIIRMIATLTRYLFEKPYTEILKDAIDIKKKSGHENFFTCLITAHCGKSIDAFYAKGYPTGHSFGDFSSIDEKWPIINKENLLLAKNHVKKKEEFIYLSERLHEIAKNIEEVPLDVKKELFFIKKEKL